MMTGTSVGCGRFRVSFTQGKTLDELKDNVKDAYHLMTEDQETPVDTPVQTEEIQV